MMFYKLLERVARIELAQSGRKHDILATKLYPQICLYYNKNRQEIQ